MRRTISRMRGRECALQSRPGVGTRGLAGWGLVALLAVGGCGVDRCPGGELTIEGNLTVKTNLVVQGQLSSSTLVLTNLAITGQATLQEAVILRLCPQGDLSMGPYTNRTDR